MGVLVVFQSLVFSLLTDATGHCRLITSGDSHGVSDAGAKGCESKRFKDIGTMWMIIQRTQAYVKETPLGEPFKYIYIIIIMFFDDTSIIRQIG